MTYQVKEMAHPTAVASATLNALGGIAQRLGDDIELWMQIQQLTSKIRKVFHSRLGEQLAEKLAPENVEDDEVKLYIPIAPEMTLECTALESGNVETFLKGPHPIQMAFNYHQPKTFNGAQPDMIENEIIALKRAASTMTSRPSLPPTPSASGDKS